MSSEYRIIQTWVRELTINSQDLKEIYSDEWGESQIWGDSEEEFVKRIIDENGMENVNELMFEDSIIRDFHELEVEKL